MDEIVVIELFGEEYKFKSDNQVKNPIEVVQQLKHYIKEAETLLQNRPSDKNKIVVLLLAAMNLSRDFHELRFRYSDLENEFEKRISSILEKINKGFEKD